MSIALRASRENGAMALYAALPLQRGQIRLLYLLPDHRTAAPLQAELVVVDVDQVEHEYMALSYCWSKTPSPDPILVNNREIAISLSLDAVLRQLRDIGSRPPTSLDDTAPQSIRNSWCFGLEQQDSPIWVDAICINQQNDEEKAQQIRLMKDIYSSARPVILWLGCEAEDTTLAFRFMYALAEIQDWNKRQRNQTLGYLLQAGNHADAWLALGRLFDRPWWTRLWIMQEIVMSEESIFMCGRHSIHGILWGKTAAVTYELVEALDRLVEASLVPAWSGYFGKFYHAHARFLLLFQLRVSLYKSRRGLPRHGSCTGYFEQFLTLAKGCRASNDRDKIFGIIGLAEAFGDTVPVAIDYKLSTRELYIAVAVALHERAQNFDFLEHLEDKHSIDFSRNFELPSWVPDWTLRSTASLGRIIGLRGMRTWSGKDQKHIQLSEIMTFTRDSVPNCSFEPQSNKMIVKGFRFDTVKQRAQRFYDLNQDLAHNLAVTSKRYGSRICESRAISYHAKSVAAFWEDRLGSPDKLDVFSTHVNRQFNCFDPLLDSDKPSKSQIDVFETKEQHTYGICSSILQDGDIICGLFGARLPVILRPRQQGTWRIVDCCLLLGRELMQGLAMDDLQQGKFFEQEFIIV
ncbi:hypothetical protein LTR70_007672 [Exophiala xenobiotica]|uniref:Heterokaryon incompatibility domain-containing protein n=1 Tax=Lithohypha guttulata TaxID=1690604 RepID=A0ABR0K1I8_9EURO|nr:hypothetical protein LTR24_007941 [Lithohypha guttulata]KAK5313368.1 hypothetical protein LTR70_007672 [Exophiala xenobiotica]